MITVADRTVPITVLARSPASLGITFRIIAPIDRSNEGLPR
jgi:hypothetical protein